jgi:cytochrome c-type biogenesis protein CcmH/NrfF
MKTDLQSVMTDALVALVSAREFILSRWGTKNPAREDAIERLREALQCKQCRQSPVREILDGDALCQACCDNWARGENPLDRPVNVR